MADIKKNKFQIKKDNSSLSCDKSQISLNIPEFSYSPNSPDAKCVLKNISLQVKRGEFICLCGPNGCGKSTLLTLLEKSANSDEKKLSLRELLNLKNNLLKSEERKALNAGHKKSEKTASFLPQKEFSAWDTSVLNLILSGRFIYSKGRYTKKDIEIAKNSARTLEIEDLLEKSVYEISDGEFQKARIARTLSQELPFLIFDEPCANLDFTVQKELLELFEKLASGPEKKGIIISIHDINAAACFCKNLNLLCPLSERNREGGLIEGNAGQVLSQENLEKAFGKALKTFLHPVFNCPQIY